MCQVVEAVGRNVTVPSVPPPSALLSLRLPRPPISLLSHSFLFKVQKEKERVDVGGLALNAHSQVTISHMHATHKHARVHLLYTWKCFTLPHVHYCSTLSLLPYQTKG